MVIYTDADKRLKQHLRLIKEKYQCQSTSDTLIKMYDLYLDEKGADEKFSLSLYLNFAFRRDEVDYGMR